jgi:mono/diheme cytochrome c family protein
MPRWIWLFALSLGPSALVHADAGETASAPPAASRTGGTVVVTPRGLLVAERHAGTVVRADAQGNATGRVEFGGELGEIVADGRGRAFVADRAGDRIVELDDGETLSAGRSVAVVEPFGLAVSPDGATLLATSVAEHALVAIGTDDLRERWRIDLAAEPRGVAISADGSEAVVGFLSRGILAVVDLADRDHGVRWQSLDPRDQLVVVEDEFGEEGSFVDVREAPSRFRVPQGAGRRYARNAFAVGYLGDQAITTYQLATPQLVHKPKLEDEDSYGGADVDTPPVVHRLSWIARAGRAEAHHASTDLDVHQPRALAYDAANDTLYVGGYGDDRVVAVADASTDVPWVPWSVKLERRDPACGIDGMVVDGTTLRVHCELTRRLVSLPLDHGEHDDRKIAKLSRRGPELAASRRSALVERGAEIFRRANDGRLSEGGTLACATCHPEGRADGLTWRLGAHVLQTPMLAGRIVGTAPYKWDGQDATLRDSLRHTINRLGGNSGFVGRDEIAALAAYVASLPAPKAPRAKDPDALARGRAVFEDKTLGCASCHGGATLTDGAQYPLKSNLEQTDTPSLVGLAHSAPYYHDGSADSIRGLLTDRGSIHDMAELGALSEAQLDDLGAYLASL